MQIRILKIFDAPGASRPFQPGDFITVPEYQARKWISEGKAAALPGQSAPTKRKREKAVRL